VIAREWLRIGVTGFGGRGRDRDRLLVLALLGCGLIELVRRAWFEGRGGRPA
jgi:hypothetical protein